MFDYLYFSFDWLFILGHSRLFNKNSNSCHFCGDLILYKYPSFVIFNLVLGWWIKIPNLFPDFLFLSSQIPNYPSVPSFNPNFFLSLYPFPIKSINTSRSMNGTRRHWYKAEQSIQNFNLNIQNRHKIKWYTTTPVLII